MSLLSLMSIDLMFCFTSWIFMGFFVGFHGNLGVFVLDSRTPPKLPKVLSALMVDVEGIRKFTSATHLHENKTSTSSPKLLDG